MFSSRQGFFLPIITEEGFGNSSFWSTTVNASRYLSMTSTTDLVTWRAASGFTIEYWIYQTSQWPGTINPGPGNQNTTSTNYWTFGPGANGTSELYFWGPGQNFIRTNNNVLSLDTWHNIAMVATTTGSNTTVSLYVDGTREQIKLNTGSFADTQTVTVGVISTGTQFRMGRYASQYWRGYMDNMRVSNIDRYSGASYTVQTSPFTDDANTQLLMICDGANGSTSFTDSSSFNKTITNNANLVTISDAKQNHTN